jgi:hypothetical protein
MFHILSSCPHNQCQSYIFETTNVPTMTNNYNGKTMSNLRLGNNQHLVNPHKEKGIVHLGLDFFVVTFFPNSLPNLQHILHTNAKP